MRQRLTIGSRGSALALRQARLVAAQLEAAYPGLACPIEIIKTTGDIMRDASLVAISGKGVFTKEIEEALLDGLADLAVHSLKDLPTSLPPGLALAAITEREDPRDALVARPGVASLADLPPGATLGTSSPRRRSQLRAWRPDLRVVDLRGNVETRLRKIETENLDGVILACAGLRRLGLGDRLTEAIDPSILLPAVGQGALGLETREGDGEVLEIVGRLDHAETAAACRAERAFLAAMGGGCAVPIAAFAVCSGDLVTITAAVEAPSGGSVLRHEMTGSVEHPERAGRDLAARFAPNASRAEGSSGYRGEAL
jgi:hydroxymethylbilane synthase